jgi:ketosteroid isomerase-like protein
MAVVLGLFLAGAIAFGQQSQPSATANPSPTPTASDMSTESQNSVADHLKTLENDWMNAVKDKNAEELSKIEAPDYQFIMPDGKTRGRPEDIAAMKDSSYTEASVSGLEVRIFGNTAIVTGLAHIKGTENGKDISGDYRFTDVFVNRNGDWQAVNTESTKVTP